MISSNFTRFQKLNKLQQGTISTKANKLQKEVYSSQNNNLKIRHFVSDSNDDISDPARKFGEAVEKLVQWNKIMKLNTMGIKAFEDTYKNGTYPGLGVAKKYSIMHHLELMSVYLNEVEK